VSRRATITLTPPRTVTDHDRIRRRPVLGGLINEYERSLKSQVIPEGAGSVNPVFE
jgi:hypothetical protein